MLDFDAVPLITIGDQSISIGKVLQYFQLSGKLLPWLKDIVEQHVIFEAIRSRDGLEVMESEIDQAIIDFRLKNQLTEAQAFEQWLNAQGMDFVLLKNRFVLSLKIEKLKDQIAAPNLQTFFEQQKPSLDQVEFFYLIAPSQEIAEEINGRLAEQNGNFEQVAKEYALTESSQVSVVRRTFTQAQLPEALRKTCESASPGDLIGPLEVEQRWCLFRVEQFLPAVLEGQVKQALREKLVEQWMADQVQQLPVRLGASGEVESEERELAMAS